MSTILSSLPYFERRSTVVVRGREEVVKPTQIIIWVSITSVDQRDFDPATGRFPAILDTGLSHNFAIQEELLNRWAGFDRRNLRKLRDITLRGDIVPLHEAEVWLHPNRRGERDSPGNRVPFPLQLENGIAVYPRGNAQCSPAAAAGPPGFAMVETPSHHRQRASPRLAAHSAAILVLLTQRVGVRSDRGLRTYPQRAVSR